MLACRLKKASYIDVAYSAPLKARRKCGRPSKTVSCLKKQDSELQDDESENVLVFNDDDHEPQIVKTIAKKRGRKPKGATNTSEPPVDQELRSSKRLRNK